MADTSSGDPQLPPASCPDRFATCLENIAAHADRESFKLLFEYYAPRLKAYLMRLGHSSDQAEELTQEVMLTIWRKAGQFNRKQASPAAWIFRIARNRGIDAHRRKQRPKLDADDPLLRPEDLPEPDALLEATEVAERIQAELSYLPKEQSMVLTAAFYHGLAHSEIAKKYKLPLGTVKSRLRLGFDRLRLKLREQ